MLIKIAIAFFNLLYAVKLCGLCAVYIFLFDKPLGVIWADTILLLQ